MQAHNTVDCRLLTILQGLALGGYGCGIAETIYADLAQSIGP